MHNFRKSKRMRDFDVILRKNGYTPTRCKGSHFVYINRTTHRIMPVNKDLNDMEENHREILVISNAKGKKFSLIETDNNYIVACGYSALERWGRQWEHGVYYMFSNDKEKLVALNEATEKLFEKVNADYIPRCRLEELATLFKDGLISDDRESAMEYFDEICEMTDEEKEWFGIEEDSSIANTKFENPMYNKGYDDGFSDGANMESEEE